MSETVRQPLTATVEARELRDGDRVVDRGIVSKVEDNGMLVVFFEANDVDVLTPDTKVEIVIEDHGEDVSGDAA